MPSCAWRSHACRSGSEPRSSFATTPDLDYAAIGDALGISTGTVASTLNAAHTALRTRLEEVRT